MEIRTVLIDDNEIDRDLAETYIQRLPFLDLKASFHNPLDALPLLESAEVDLLLCDVDMPEISGLELAKSLSSPPAIIFMTSFPEYAVQGFEVEAVDYLVKPFGFERFLKAVNRASELLDLKKRKGKDFYSGAERVGSDHFFIRSEHRFVRVNFSQVLYIEALKDYVKVVTPEQSFLSALNLKVIEDQLPAADFMRIHRSYIVNLNNIEAIANTDVVTGGHTIPLGDTYRDRLFNSVVAQRLIKR